MIIYNFSETERTMNMCRFVAFGISLSLFAPAALLAQGNSSQPADNREAYTTADIRVIAPGVVYNAGLLDLAAAYSKETGKKVAVTSVGMGSIVRAITTNNPPADV